jgi:hypothetical protein
MWLRIEGRMPQHRKLAPLSDAAWRLHWTAAAWSCDEGLDGLIPAGIPQTLTGVARGAKLSRAISELEAAKLWDVCEGGHRVHGYLKLNPSAAELSAIKAKKAAAGHAGGLRSGESRRSKTEAPASRLVEPHSNPLQSEGSPQPPKGGTVRKRGGLRYTDPEERRRVRNGLASDAADGFFGPDVKARYAAATGPQAAALVDELERGEHPRIRLLTALP